MLILVQSTAHLPNGLSGLHAPKHVEMVPAHAQDSNLPSRLGEERHAKEQRKGRNTVIISIVQSIAGGRIGRSGLPAAFNVVQARHPVYEFKMSNSMGANLARVKAIRLQLALTRAFLEVMIPSRFQISALLVAKRA